jgi:hypothetical protein
MTHTRTFVLIRDVDVTGMSGTGAVADGVVFPDGTTVLRWRDVTGPNYDRGVRATTVVHESPESVDALHGHNGATHIEWGPASAVCKHCGDVVWTSHPTAAPGARFSWVHLLSGLGRCRPDEEAGRPYGFNAEPEGTDCQIPCMGSNPDPGQPHA